MMKNRLSALPIALGTILLLVVAIWNAFPLLYADTSTYLVSGFELETPFDRPISYGVLLRIFSLNGLLIWLVPLVQSALVAWLTLRLFHTNENPKLKWFGVLTLLLSVVFSTASWYTSLLVPDIFTGIGVLALANLFLKECSKGTAILLYTVFTVSVTTHLGHISYFLAVIVLTSAIKLFVGKHIFGSLSWRRLAVAGALTLLSIASMGSAFAKARNAFFLAAMLENGVLEPYLNEACETQELAICQYQDELPQKAWEFLWKPNSPFAKMGGFKGTREEFGDIVRETLTTPKYIGWHMKASVKATYRQAYTFGVADGTGAFREGSELNERIHNYLPNAVENFEYSRQYKDQLKGMVKLNKFYVLTTIIFALLVLAWLLRWNRLDQQTKGLFVFLLGALLLNAWVSGTFGNAIPRLGGKMIWMLPVIAMLGFRTQLLKPRSK